MVNDSEIFGAMMEGIEHASHLIARYAIFESLYLHTSSAAKEQLMQHLIKLYAAIMRYLVKAGRYYGQGSAGVFWTLYSYKDCILTRQPRTHSNEHRPESRGREVLPR